MKKITFIMLITLLFFCIARCTKKDNSTPNPSASTQTLNLQPDASTGKDATIWYVASQSTPKGPTNTTNYGNDMEFISMEWTFSGSPGTLQSLIQFDLSSIPSSATITSAKLSLYHCDQCIDTTSALSGSNAALLQRITSTWDESTVTWNTKPSVTTINQVVLPASTTYKQDYTDIDVTTLVQDMVKDPSSSFGFLFSQQNSTYYRSLVFASSDHSNVALHPKLVVQY